MQWFEQCMWPPYWYALRDYQGVPLVNKFVRWLFADRLVTGIEEWLEQFDWDDVT